MGTSAAVLGASGYSGGEVLRLLARHPSIDVVAAAGASRVGDAVADVHPNLTEVLDLQLVAPEQALARDPEVVFSCLPHGALAAAGVPEAPIVIDLSGDHRSDQAWAYGLTEFARSEVASSTRIANPGCYPTATLLALVPLARAGLIRGPIVVDAISGVSGAGRAAEDALLFSNVSGAIAAYGSTEHRHIPEMERGLSSMGDLDARVSFTPHLAPIPRGLLITARAVPVTDATDDVILGALESAYIDEPFVTVTGSWPSTKSVAGTNRAIVSARVDERAGFVIATCAIDNLGKGAAGQAVQNANVALGIDEGAGLEEVALWP